jgi:hypothetical protein
MLAEKISRFARNDTKEEIEMTHGKRLDITVGKNAMTYGKDRHEIEEKAQNDGWENNRSDERKKSLQREYGSI